MVSSDVMGRTGTAALIGGTMDSIAYDTSNHMNYECFPYT